MGAKKHTYPDSVQSYPELLLSASMLAASLSDGCNNLQLQTLINYVDLLGENLSFILAQRIIDAKAQPRLEINLGS